MTLESEIAASEVWPWWRFPDVRLCIEQNIIKLNEYGIASNAIGRPLSRLLETIDGLADCFAHQCSLKEVKLLNFLRHGLQQSAAKRWFARHLRTNNIRWLNDFDSDRELIQALANYGDAQIVLEDFVHAFFEFPNRRLATYGTLTPDGPNHHRIRQLGGVWSSGYFSGKLTNEGWGVEQGFPGARWDSTANEWIAVQVLESRKLPQFWDCLDSFEGSDYERTWVPINLHSRVQVCNLYAISGTRVSLI